MAKNLHTVKNPLILIKKESGSDFYKVNKPNQGTQKLVSLEVAEKLKDALAVLINNGYQIPSNKDIQNAIKAYNESLD